MTFWPAKAVTGHSSWSEDREQTKQYLEEIKMLLQWELGSGNCKLGSSKLDIEHVDGEKQ